MSDLRAQVSRIVREYTRTPDGDNLLAGNRVVLLAQAIETYIKHHPDIYYKTVYEKKEVNPGEYDKLRAEVYRLKHELYLAKKGL